MSRRSIILDDSRARAAAAGTLRLIVEPMPKQPTAEVTICGVKYFTHLSPNGKPTIGYPPNRPGDDLAVKEAWRALKGSNLYRARGDCLDTTRDCWISANRMPLDAVRTHLRVVKVEARRVQSITNTDLLLHLGIEPAKHNDTDDPWNDFYLRYEEPFQRDWDRRHGHKPGLAWADDPWCWFTTVETAKAMQEGGQ
jgi:hypothetical protein